MQKFLLSFAAVLACVWFTASSASAAEPESDSVYQREGYLGHTRIGPTMGLGAPEGLRFGVNAKLSRGLVSAGGAIAFVPTVGIPGADATAARTSAEAYMRIDPFRGAFFLGLAGGYADTRTSAGANVRGYDVKILGTMQNLYVAPHLGFQWVLPAGFTVGFDAGLELPVGGSGPSFAVASPNAPAGSPTSGNVGSDQVRSLGSKYGKALDLATGPVPVVHLLEIGFLWVDGSVEGATYSAGTKVPGTVYRVVRHLATGGMGSVYDVEDVSVGKRYVLKTLHPRLVARQDLARRMEAEARTLARLSHPNIVDVVTAGVTTDDVKMPYYVMERLVGQNVRVLLEKKGAFPLTDAYQIAIDVLDALEHAHENNVIHRDVKPENIFLHRNANGTNTTKLLDFGIMRLLGDRLDQTQGNNFIGTLRYASPEQIQGEDLGPPTDIYSLGVVLYEMLCGRGPFDDVGDAYAIGRAHAKTPAPPISDFAELPPGAASLVMSALAKTPHARPRDCFTFAAELRKLRRDEEVSPRVATAVNVLTSVGEPTQAGDSQAYRSTVAAERPPMTPAPGPQTIVDPTKTAPLLPHQRMASGPPPSPAANATPAPDALPRIVDWSAPTRTSLPAPALDVVAPNGTLMDALAERAPLEVPTPSGHPPPPQGDVFFPAVRPSLYPSSSSGTGPLAGEARSRAPSEAGVVGPILGAMLVAAFLVGGAVLAVKKPWAHHAAAPAAPVVAAPASVAPAPIASAAPAPLASAVAAPASAPVALVAAPPAPVGLAAPPVAASAPKPAVVATPTVPVAPGATPPRAPAPQNKPATRAPLKPEDVPYE